MLTCVIENIIKQNKLVAMDGVLHLQQYCAVLRVLRLSKWLNI